MPKLVESLELDQVANNDGLDDFVKSLALNKVHVVSLEEGEAKRSIKRRITSAAKRTKRAVTWITARETDDRVVLKLTAAKDEK